MLSGRTGAGKTLFLRALADLDPVDSGTVHLGAAERGTLPASQWRRQVLYVHQSGVTLPGTVRENVLRLTALGNAVHAGADRPMPPGLRAEADAERLSGGERQALALHIALLCEPQILLLDECTSALDPEAAGYWEARLRSWVDAGHAALWVAHDRTLAGRVRARTEHLA